MKIRRALVRQELQETIKILQNQSHYKLYEDDLPTNFYGNGSPSLK